MPIGWIQTGTKGTKNIAQWFSRTLVQSEVTAQYKTPLSFCMSVRRPDVAQRNSPVSFPWVTLVRKIHSKEITTQQCIVPGGIRSVHCAQGGVCCQLCMPLHGCGNWRRYFCKRKCTTWTNRTFILSYQHKKVTSLRPRARLSHCFEYPLHCRF